MITDSDGLLKHIHFSKEFRFISELFSFIEQDSFLRKGLESKQQQESA